VHNNIEIVLAPQGKCKLNANTLIKITNHHITYSHRSKDLLQKTFTKSLKVKYWYFSVGLDFALTISTTFLLDHPYCMKGCLHLDETKKGSKSPSPQLLMVATTVCAHRALVAASAITSVSRGALRSDFNMLMGKLNGGARIFQQSRCGCHGHTCIQSRMHRIAFNNVCAWKRAACTENCASRRIA
jgi:hypothetical protein